MAGVNKVILVGHLGKDPEVKKLESGISVAKFSMATTESYKDKNGNKVENTEWHNIVVWRTLAEVAEKWLKKGQLIYLEGKLKTNVVEDKEKGTKRYFTEIIGDTFTMLGGKKDGSQDSKSEEQEPVMAGEEKDLPF